MTTPFLTELDERERAADAAAARGNFLDARALLEQIVAAKPHYIDAWLKLAGARHASGDTEGAIEATTQALATEPLNAIALLTRGRLYEAFNRPRLAARDYRHAIAQMPDSSVAPPPHFQSLIAHARAVAERHEDRIVGLWDSAIAAGPALDSDRRARIERYKTNALRRTRVYHSEPSHYHYPGLVEREFHERGDFPWLPRLESATDAIRSEMAALVASGGATAEPYVQYAIDEPVQQWAPLNHSLDWTAFHLLKGGKTISENAGRCPATMALLATLPQPKLAARGPNAMFSLLKPHTRIPPHVGVSNTRLVCHLPLVVPANCWFRVGAETRDWHEGKAIVFDDTIEHEAANDSNEPRIVMIFDVWHPGLDETERDAIARIMEINEELDGANL